MSAASPDVAARQDFALRIALQAGELILKYYQQAGLTVERKRDSSPVTIADRGAEELLRREIEREFPGDAILGEEYGEKAGNSGYRWILDPVDGTKSFIHGVPLFGTLIGVERIDQCVAGVCHFPALGETAWGAIGLGSWWRQGTSEPRPAKVSAVQNMADAMFCFTTVQGFGRIGRTDAFHKFVESAGLTRGWGDCYGHYLVATGRAELMVDPLMNPWDIAALIPIVQEAGGCFIDWNGGTSIHSGNGISVIPELRDAVLKITRA